MTIEDIRIWSVLSRFNGTVRPLTPYDIRNTELAYCTLPDISKQDSVWTIFVERVTDLSFALQFDYANEIMSRQPPPFENSPFPELSPQQTAPKLPVFKPDDEVMIFFKFYDPKTTTMRYMFRMYLAKNWTLSGFNRPI